MKKLFKRLQNRRGTTMVNVLVAFAILSLTLVLFQQAVTLASNIFMRSEDLRRETETLFSAFYEDEGHYTRQEGTETYTFTDGAGNSFTVKSDITAFTEAGSSYSVYYFGGRS